MLMGFGQWHGDISSGVVVSSLALMMTMLVGSIEE